MRNLFLFVFIVLLAISAVSAQDAAETEIQFIEITGPASIRDAEISSLVWHGDTLLLITENPFIYATEGNIGQFFALDKDDILDYLAEDAPEPLEPYPVPLLGKDIEDAVGGYSVAFDGFESAVIKTGDGYFSNDQIFLTIEADTVSDADPTMRSYLISGSIAPDLSSISLDMDRFIELPYQTDFNNMSYEALLLNDNNLVAMYEANGEIANPENVAYNVDLATGEVTSVAMDHINYRVTDATNPDEDGMFWTINYFFVGEDFLAADDDPLFAEYGTGASQSEFDGFERLVAFQITDNGVELADVAPIQLLMTEDSRGRNWEGIERLDDAGFLIVTDKWPQTLLGFVPAN